MATQVRYPRSYIDYASGEWGVPWNNPERIYAADGSEASVTLQAPDRNQTVILFYNFDFGIPESATIQSIAVEFRGRTDLTGDSHILLVQPVVGAETLNDAYGGPMTTSAATWSSTTEVDLTPAEMNGNADSNFGVVLIAAEYSYDGSPTLYCDYIKVTVNYEDPNVHYEGGCLIPFSGSGVLSKRIITPRSVTGRLRLWSPDRLTLFMETTAFNSLQITRRFVGNCLLEAYFPAYSEEAYYIIEGGWVEDDEGEWYRIHYRRATKDNVQLIAYGPHKVLSQRITVPASGQYGITVTGSADSVIKSLISQTIANAGRDLPILVAAVRSGGTSIAEVSRYKNLAEEVERICYANDLGESFTISGTDFIFDTYAGTDRTRGNTAGNAPAIFSVRYDNLEDWAHAIASTDEITTVYVAGQGSGTTRTMVIVGASTISEDRFELFKDGRDTNSAAILASRGAEAVFPPAESFSAKANTSSNLTYNTDYALGDLVTIEIPERTAIYNASTGLWEKVERYRSEDKRITEIVRTYEGGAMDIDLVFGEAPKTRGDKQSEVQSNLSRLEAI